MTSCAVLICVWCKADSMYEWEWQAAFVQAKSVSAALTALLTHCVLLA